MPLEKMLNAIFMMKWTKHFEINGNVCFNSQPKFQKLVRGDTFPHPEVDNMESNALFPSPLGVHLQTYAPNSLANTPLELVCREFPKINTEVLHQSLNSRLTGILR